MLQYDFEFNNETASNHNLYINSRPDIPVGKETIDFVEISGRESPLAVKTGEYENIEITITCAFKCREDRWHEQAQELRKWLKGSGILVFLDCKETFRKVKDVEIGSIKREMRIYGRFDVTFVCDPFEYLLTGQEVIDIGTSGKLYNPYGISRPVFKLTGNKTATLNVNGNKMIATIGQNLTIDTDLFSSYREDGKIMNTSVAGNYDELWLKPGDNTISITSGCTVKVIPNWRYL